MEQHMLDFKLLNQQWVVLLYATLELSTTLFGANLTDSANDC